MAIAITDHHDMAFIRYCRQAVESETDSNGKPLHKDQRLVVFPGMELTLGVPCQALLIFDADFPEDLFSLAMNALTITPNPETDAKTAPVHRLNHLQSLRQLKEELDKHSYLRERYIVLPNVSEGEFSLLRKGQAGKYVEMPWVGGFVDGGLDKLGQGNRDILSGKAKEWGNKRIACFQTSDDRYADRHELGKASTWIKWAMPTAEALRQACLAQESRVSQGPPRLPSVVITGLSVSNSSFLGPFDLELNPQYNVLIGGRGTGKSTILEYLRWALCDQPPSAVDEDAPNYQVRRSRLIEQTLKPLNATVEVGFSLNGVPHLVRRNGSGGELLIKISTDEMRPCTEEEVRSLLPIQGYSQKQLSDVSVRTDELLRFITSPIRAELTEVERELAEQSARVRQAYASRLRQRELSLTVQARELEQKSLSEQAASVRGSLKDLPKEDEAALDLGKRLEVGDRAVQSWQVAIASLRDSAINLRAVVQSHLQNQDEPPTEPDEEPLRLAHAEYRHFFEHANEALQDLIARAEKLTAPIAGMDPAAPWRRWADRLAAVRDAYKQAIERSSANAETLRKLKEVEGQLAKHSADTARVADQFRGLANADSAYQAERAAWLGLLRKRDDLLDGQCTALTTSSGGHIRARVQRQGNPANFVNSLRQVLMGSRVTGTKVEALGHSIVTAPDSGLQWQALLEDLSKISEFDIDRDGVGRRPVTPALSNEGLTTADLDRISRVLRPNDWLTLSLTPIESMPIFEYRAREADYIPFRNASAGQQATALLKTLLNQEGPPLIIDQPEEDLDNPVILEIVRQVWLAKQGRQLILTSHNANLVVNGDAELVAWCDYRAAGDQSRGTIAGIGAIDIPDVCNAIKRIMEGGEAAFNLRKEKYGF